MKKQALSQKEEYLQFQVDMLNSKFKGQHTEAQIVEKLINLFRKGNPYAKSALEKANEEFSPKSNIINSFWKRAETEKFIKDVGAVDPTKL